VSQGAGVEPVIGKGFQSIHIYMNHGIKQISNIDDEREALVEILGLRDLGS